MEVELKTAQNGVVSLKICDLATGKRATATPRIKKQLKKTYESSKFFGYDTVLLGVLHVDEKNQTSLVLHDIMLASERKAGYCSKRYYQRYENLILRFLTSKPSDVKFIFSSPWSEQTKNVFENVFVKTNRTEKIVYRKDSTSFSGTTIAEDIWKDHEGKIVSFDECAVKQREFNDKQEIVSELEVPAISAFIVKNEDGLEDKVTLDDIPDSMKVDFKKSAESDIGSVVGKTCRYREYSFEDHSGFVFLDAEI